MSKFSKTISVYMVSYTKTLINGALTKAKSLNQVNLVCPLHCPIYNVLTHDYVQGVFCTFLCAHISTQIIFVCNCSHFCANIFEGTTYLRAIVRAHKSCAYADCRQIVNRTSVTSEFIQSSCVSLCLFPRWSEQSRTKKSC